MECYFCEETVGHEDCDRCDAVCADCHIPYGCE